MLGCWNLEVKLRLKNLLNSVVKIRQVSRGRERDIVGTKIVWPWEHDIPHLAF